MLRTLILLALTFLPAISLIAQDNLPTVEEAKLLGLEVHWITNSEKFQPNVGIPSARLWPDSKAKEEYITLRIGKRIVARIDASQKSVDYARYRVLDLNTVDPGKPIGMEGARAIAKVIVEQYRVLGREVIATETIQAKTFLATLSDTGGVHLLDAETGEKLWLNSIGDPRLPCVGPAIDDNYVVALNGSSLYFLSRENGSILNERKISNSVAAMPQMLGDTVFVPMLDGTIAGFNKETGTIGEQTLHFTGALRVEPAVSADNKFIIWPNKNHLYTARMGETFELWSRLQTLGDIPNPVTILPDGFIAVNSEGTVLRMNYDREQNIIWRANIGLNVYQRAFVDATHVVLTTATGYVVCLDLETGKQLWKNRVPGVARALTLTSKAAYFQDFNNGLIAVSMEDGAVIGRISKTLAAGIENIYTDRIYLRATNGKLMCMREFENVAPVFLPVVDVIRGQAPPENSQLKDDDKASLKENKDDDFMNQPPKTDTPKSTNPFEGNPFGGDNPFGGSNPFGAGATESDSSNPFGN